MTGADPPAVGHVLLTADAVGGVWTFAMELAEQLSRLGVRSTIATMGDRPRAAQREMAARVPNLRVVESEFKLEWMEDPWRDVALAGEWLLGLEDEERPDVVHLNGYVHASLSWRAPCVVGAHSCVLSWWNAVLGGPAPSSYARYRLEVARGIRAADAVVAPTRAMLEALAEHYGTPRRGVVIPNGVGAARFSVGPKERFVLAAGRRWDLAKNFDMLTFIGPRLRWPIYIAGGDGAADAPARGPGVHALGWLDPDTLRGWMARAGVYALPARYEPFGLSVLEAALSGCALVLGDIPSLRETWGDAALYAAPADAEALAERIDRLTTDDAARVRMSSAARARGLELTGERMALRYLDLYRQVVSRRPGRASVAPVPGRPPRSEGASTVRRCG
jgi:glycosyltransferase involved in cell wall biosynthesis